MTVGIHSRPTSAFPANPTTGQTVTFDQTANAWKVWNGTRWIGEASRSLGFYNVKTDYGAATDGMTAASTSIQAALDDAHTAGGGWVHAPFGTYLLDTRLTVYSNTKLTGDGWGTIFKVSASINTAQGQAIRTVGSGTTTSNLMFADFQIDGNKANVALDGTPNDAKQSALMLDTVSGVVARHLYIHDAVESGIYIQNSPTRFVVDGCDLQANGKTSAAVGHGISIAVSPTYFRLVNNYITGSLRGGIAILSEGGLHADTWVVTGNICRLNLEDGIQVGDSAIADGLIDHYIRNGVLCANVCVGNGRYGIVLSENATLITGKTGIIQALALNGNVVTGNTQHGTAFLVTNNGLIRRIVMAGSVSQDNGTWGVAVNATGVSDVLIDSNSLTGNPTAPVLDSGTRTVQGVNKTDITTATTFTAGLSLTRTAPAYTTTVGINAALGNAFDITVTDAVAFTVANPTNAIDGQRISITVRNASGTTTGATTFGTLYKMAAWTAPANTTSRTIDFKFNSTNWIEASRTPADVPN